jgi:hypothetical protein
VPPPSNDLLEKAYEALDFRGGRLLRATSSPRSANSSDWRDVGDWLVLADRMDAESMFFVGEDPVVLFTRMPSGANEADVLRVYRRAWSLSRPRCLFLATDTELRVYGLSTPPTTSADTAEPIRPLEIVTRAADVADALAAYHRVRFETGELFEDQRFDDAAGRADTHLLRDVRFATRALVAAGLPATVAHTLIERAILVRYLEDRSIVTPDYLEALAEQDDFWSSILWAPSDTPDLGIASVFIACLRSKSLTYEIFLRLADDFNGDLFVVSESEQDVVTVEHLSLVASLLSGSGPPDQPPLYLWAYDFSVIPTSLISSMYEEFYRSSTEDVHGTHYTPPQLVEFVLSEVLTPDVLNTHPVVCDPACGSGIFLVEAFRRIVRHEMARRKRRLSSADLAKILTERLSGVDLNGEAIRLAAFNLYLAYLNYQTPADIRAAGPLPRLIHRPGDAGERHPVLMVGDAFSPTAAEDTQDTCPDQLPRPTFDVIVGNPPWTEPGQDSSRRADAWAKKAGLDVGDRNLSQLFLWRALTLLSPKGVAGLLVGASALHNARATSRRFRQQWLNAVRLDAVVNFTPARDLFFEGGIAPFMLVRFARHENSPEDSVPLSYRTVRPSRSLRLTKSLEHARLDQRWVSQQQLISRDYLWKTYAWGGHRDEALLRRLDVETRLEDFLSSEAARGYGYQRGPLAPSPRLARLPSLRTFEPWGPLQEGWFEAPPTGVKRQPDESLYQGRRLLVARGIKSGFGPRARIESGAFSFRHNIYCLPLSHLEDWKGEVLLGIILSALGRYRLFMTSGSWGVWHDSLVPDDLLKLPVRLPEVPNEFSRQVCRAVKELAKATDDASRDQLSLDQLDPPSVVDALSNLDRAVFELFGLLPAERDLVTDFIEFTLPLVGRSSGWDRLTTRSSAGTRTTASDEPLARYLDAFLGTWNRELPRGSHMTYRIVGSPGLRLVTAIFEMGDAGNEPSVEESDQEWEVALRRLSESLDRPLTSAIATTGVVRAVSDQSIVVVKRDEARLWTASTGREDAEATMLQAMALRDA